MLITLADLSGGQVGILFHTPKQQLTTGCNTSHTTSKTFFQLMGTLPACGIQTYVLAKHIYLFIYLFITCIHLTFTHAYINKEILKKEICPGRVVSLFRIPALGDRRRRLACPLDPQHQFEFSNENIYPVSNLKSKIKIPLYLQSWSRRPEAGAFDFEASQRAYWFFWFG